MRTKMFMILILVATVATVGAFASGGKEEQAQPARPGWRRMPPGRVPPAEAPAFSEEKITVTGALYFENRMHPELESGGEEYELLVPRFYVYDLDLKEGQTVTVEGYTVEGMPCCEDGEEESEVHVWVTKAVIDGKEYDLESGGRWYGHMGPGMGMMGPGRRPYGYYDRRGWGRRR